MFRLGAKAGVGGASVCVCEGFHEAIGNHGPKLGARGRPSPSVRGGKSGSGIGEIKEGNR